MCDYSGIGDSPGEYTALASVRSVISRFSLMALALWPLSNALGAQPVTPSHTAPHSAVDSLVLRANRQLSLGDTAAALALLAQATDLAPRHVEALYQRGRLLVRHLSLGLSGPPLQVLAWRLLNRGADIAPTDGRFALELGRLRLRTPVLGADAERFFRRAADIARAAGDHATRGEASWELGQVFERRYRTARHRYMYTGTIFFDQFAARSRLHYVRDFLEQQARPIEGAGSAEGVQAEQWYRDALEADPLHTPSAIGLLALLADAHRFDELSARAASFLRQQPTDATVWFAAGLASWRLGQPANAERQFAAAVERLGAPEQLEVLDIGRLLTLGDSIRVAGAVAPVRAAATIRFWESADPLLSTPHNEAQLEYFARMAITMLRYDEPGRGLRGWRTDRGQVIVRYGEPPIEALLPSTDNLAARDAAGRILTVFYYPASELSLVFSGALAMSGAVFAGDFREVAASVRADVPFQLDNVALTHMVDSIAIQVARFRSTARDTHTVVLAAAVPVATMYRDVELDAGEIALSLRRGAQDRLRMVDSQQVAVTLPVREPVEYRRTLAAPAGELRLRVEAVDPTARQANSRAQVTLDIPTVRGTALALSDVLLARRTDAPLPVMRSFDDARIAALAGTRVSPRDTFAVYLETYDAQPNPDGNVQLDVELTVTLLEIERDGDRVSKWLANLADLVGLTPEGDQQLGMRFTRIEALSGRDRIPLLVSLSLGAAPVGRYRLDVTIHDRTQMATARRSREFTISRPSS
jgi:GWxTD domain-containing protein